MPSGHAHDAITILLAAPAAVLTYAFSRDLPTAAIVAIAFIFAGLMFGPDLDTKSKPYSRWGPLRTMWLPYRTVFRHRSRWSHGLIFGTLFRVIYFLGIATLAAFASVAAYSLVALREVPNFAAFIRGWESAGNLSSSMPILEILLAVFVGMWAGAASHTLTDVAITYIKTGRAKGIL